MEGDTPPLRPQYRSSWPLLNNVTVILLVPIFALTVIFLVIPTFVSRTSIIFKQAFLNKSWDSLNIMLVLVAVLFGAFAKRNDDVPPENCISKYQQLDPDPLFEYSDRLERVAKSEGRGLRRNISSYPDLRQAPEWETGYSKFRFFDDFELNMDRSSSHKRDQIDKKVISADLVPPITLQSLPKHEGKESETGHGKSQVAYATVPPPPVALQVERKRKRRQRTRNIREKTEQSAVAPKPSPPPIPPPPPPLPPFHKLSEEGNKDKRVHSIPAQLAPPPPPPPPPPRFKFNNMFKTRKKDKRYKNQNSTSVPPPPPPPPPSFTFNKMFKTGNKHKRFENTNSASVPPSPPPPPPPPLFSKLNNFFKTDSKTKSKPIHSVTSRLQPREQTTVYFSRPPLPPKTRIDSNPSTGGKSPTPHPPPLPPFRMLEKSVVAREDFVRIQSMHSSRGSSPDLENVDLSSEKMDGGDGSGSSLTCPSPDVNMKAELFIAKLKEKWILEKINSMKKMNMGP